MPLRFNENYGETLDVICDVCNQFDIDKIVVSVVADSLEPVWAIIDIEYQSKNKKIDKSCLDSQFRDMEKNPLSSFSDSYKKLKEHFLNFSFDGFDNLVEDYIFDAVSVNCGKFFPSGTVAINIKNKDVQCESVS